MCPTRNCAVGVVELVSVHYGFAVCLWLCGVHRHVCAVRSRVVSGVSLGPDAPFPAAAVCLPVCPSVCQLALLQEPLTCPQAHPASTQPHPSLNLQSEDLPPQVRLSLALGLSAAPGGRGWNSAGTGSELGLGILPRPWTPRSQLLSSPWLEASGLGKPTSKGICAVKGAIDLQQTAVTPEAAFLH